MSNRQIAFCLVLMAVGLAVLAAACGSSSQKSLSETPADTDVAEEDEITIGGLLRVSNRTNLSLCVDGAGGFSVSDDDVDRVRNALETVLAAADDPPSEYSDPVVSLGCPPPVALTGRRLSILDRHSLEVSPLESASDVSRHRFHVYVVPPEVYETSFGGDTYATTAEEFICESDVCTSVTRGLYVTPSTSSDVIGRALRAGLVLLPPLPEPTEYSQFCLSGTPEEWCFLYDYCRAVPTDATCEDDVANPTARPETPISPAN